ASADAGGAPGARRRPRADASRGAPRGDARAGAHGGPAVPGALQPGDQPERSADAAFDRADEIAASGAQRHSPPPQRRAAPFHRPAASALALIAPNSTRATASIANRPSRPPSNQRNTIQPPSAATSRRVRLARNGHSRRPAPCEAKYNAMPRPKKP